MDGDLHEKIVDTENRLARLHADIYRYREEIRRIRIASSDPLPTERKRQKVVDALERLHKRINKKYCNTGKNGNLSGWALLLLVIVLVAAGFCWRYRHRS